MFRHFKSHSILTAHLHIDACSDLHIDSIFTEFLYFDIFQVYEYFLHIIAYNCISVAYMIYLRCMYMENI
jgi:hypothetical protein